MSMVGAANEDRPSRALVGPVAQGHVAEAAVERELAKIYAVSYGLPAGKVTARFVDDHALVCLLEELEFLPSEQFLLDNDRADELIETRRLFQKAIEPVFRAAVERATGRRVRTFTSLATVDPPINVEVFIFGSAEQP